MLRTRILLIRGALLETIPEAEQVRFLRAGFVTRAGAVRASSPPALRPGRGVLRLSAFGGAGNACALPFARSAAWAESKRSVALASAAVGAPEGERLPTSGRFRAQTGCADCVNLSARRGHGWMRLSALRLPAVFARHGTIFLMAWWCAKTRSPMRREDTSSLRAPEKQSKTAARRREQSSVFVVAGFDPTIRVVPHFIMDHRINTRGGEVGRETIAARQQAPRRV